MFAVLQTKAAQAMDFLNLNRAVSLPVLLATGGVNKEKEPCELVVK